MRPALPAAVLIAAACATVGPALAQTKPPPLGVAPAAPRADLSVKPPPLGVGEVPGTPFQRRPGTPARRPGGTQAAAVPTSKPPPLSPGEAAARRMVSSGTGFVVAPSRVLTNHHVVSGCSEMRARTAEGAELPARIAASDRRRDLALLVVEGNAGPPLAFRSGSEMRRGEGVVTYGFPLAGLLSSGPTLTTGEISALAGLSDNQRQFQISAPVQPGNSGGPLLDMAGNVVGVVVSKLNAQRVAQRTGDIPQNVNFAVKASEALDFLRSNGVEPRLAEPDGPARTAAEVGEIAHPSTVFLRCMR